MFVLSKIFDLSSKKFALPDTFLKSKNYCIDFITSYMFAQVVCHQPSRILARGWNRPL